MPQDSPPAPDPAYVRALVGEGARRSNACWLRAGGVDRLVWHAWAGDALWVVDDRGDGAASPAGSSAGSLPGATVEVVLRSADTRALLVVAEVSVTVVEPSDPRWEAGTAALAAARLNGPGADDLIATWSRTSRVLRLEPTGQASSVPPPADPSPRRALSPASRLTR